MAHTIESMVSLAYGEKALGDMIAWAKFAGSHAELIPEYVDVSVLQPLLDGIEN